MTPFRSGLAAVLLAAAALLTGCGSNPPTAHPAAAAAPTPAVPVPTPEPQQPTPPPEPTPVSVVEVAAPPSAAAAPAAPEAPPPAAAIPAPASADASSRPYRDILKLKQAGFSDEFLLNKIRTDDVSYHLTTADILELKSAGLSETVLAAMLRSGRPKSETAGAPTARRAEFDGLARVSKGALGVFGTSTKNVGRLVIEGEKVSWYDADSSKNFSIYVNNVREVFNTCVLRPGQNLCLELGLVTYTGEEYRFRDPGWKKGDNRLVSEATTYFREAFPQVFFSQRAVNDM